MVSSCGGRPGRGLSALEAALLLALVSLSSASIPQGEIPAEAVAAAKAAAAKIVAAEERAEQEERAGEEAKAAKAAAKAAAKEAAKEAAAAEAANVTSNERELFLWIIENGGYVSEKLQVRSSSVAGAGRGLFAVEEFQKGEVIVAVPPSIGLDAEEAIRSSPCPAFFDAMYNEGRPGEGPMRNIAALTMYFAGALEGVGGGESKFKTYFQDLNDHFPEAAMSRFPMFWPKELKAELRGTTAAEDYSRFDSGLVREYAVIEAQCPDFAKQVTWDKYKRYKALVVSRVCTGKDGVHALLPMFDIGNHFLPAPTKVINSVEDVAKLQEDGPNSHYGTRAAPRDIDGGSLGDGEFYQQWAKHPISVGEEITQSYGLTSNDNSLWTFGFTTPWIINSTCTASTVLVVNTADLPTRDDDKTVPVRAEDRREDLEKAVKSLSFRIDSCLTSPGFYEFMSFARYWYTDTDEDDLVDDCDLQGKWLSGEAKGDSWHLDAPCIHTSGDADSAALGLIARTAEARFNSMAGESLQDDEDLLKHLLESEDNLNVKGFAVRDALTVRRDEKVVLTTLMDFVKKQVAKQQKAKEKAEKDAKRRRRRRQGSAQAEHEEL